MTAIPGERALKVERAAVLATVESLTAQNWKAPDAVRGVGPAGRLLGGRRLLSHRVEPTGVGHALGRG